VLNGAWGGYDWKGTGRSHIPPEFQEFKGRSAAIGKRKYGSSYRKGMPVPKQKEPFKWTAAMSFTVLVHIIAVLHPLIRSHNCPQWISLLQHQRYVLSLLKWSGSIKEIHCVDNLIRQHQHGMCCVMCWIVSCSTSLDCV
jgi:hypothetical protein